MPSYAPTPIACKYLGAGIAINDFTLSSKSQYLLILTNLQRQLPVNGCPGCTLLCIPSGSPICVSYIASERASALVTGGPDKATWNTNRDACKALGSGYDLFMLQSSTTINALGGSRLITDDKASVGFSYDGTNFVDVRTRSINSLYQTASLWDKNKVGDFAANQGGILKRDSPYLLDGDDGGGKNGAICQCIGKSNTKSNCQMHFIANIVFAFL